MHLALYDNHLGGHRAAHILSITKEALSRGWRVTIIGTASFKAHAAFPQLVELVGPGNVVTTVPWVKLPARFDFFSSLAYQLRHYRNIRAAIRQIHPQPQFLYLPNIDYVDKAVALLGAPSAPVPMGGMCMRARFHFEAMKVPFAPKKRHLEYLSFQLLLRRANLALVTTADPTLVEYFSTFRKSYKQKVGYVPEIGMAVPDLDQVTAKAALGIGKERDVVLVFGAIDVRKAINELAGAVLGFDPGQRPIILIVGQTSKDFEAEFNRAPLSELAAQGLLRRIPGYADDCSVRVSFAAASVVWVAYRDHITMSGVFYQAMCAGKQTVVPRSGLIRLLAERHKAGVAVNIDDPEDIREGIRQTLCAGQNNGIDANEMAAQHSPEAFAKCICGHIASHGAEQASSCGARTQDFQP